VVYTFTPRIAQEDGGNDCIGPEQTVTISVYPRVRYEKLLSDYNGYNVSCFGKSNGFIRITPSEGLGPYTYSWTGLNGFTATSKDISGLIAGEYTMAITDAHNCTVTETFVLDQPDELSVVMVPSVSMDGAYNINCYGASTGSIAATAANGVGKVDYLWIDGAVGSNRTNLSAGSYKVIVTDSNNCQAEESVTLTEPEKIRVAFEVINTFCPDSRDGAISVDATGGVPGNEYTYIWSDNSTGQSITNLPVGRHQVIVTDMNLCSVRDSAAVRSMHEICLIIPDAFSPNDDLVNDTWVIGNIELYKDAVITIYNRWGQELWESERGYPNAWDGRSKGINMPMDGYHYVIDLHNGYKLIVGDVTLVR
jgi:gliding motility-associated-like protein